MAEAWVEIGTIRSVNPARRELRVNTTRERRRQFEGMEWIRLALREGPPIRYRVSAVRETRDGVIVALAAGVPRDTVGQMKGASIVLAPSERRPAPEGVWEREDLVGLRVKDEQDKTLGVIRSVVPTPAHDIVEIELERGGAVLVPLIDQVVAGVDLEEGTLTVGDLGPYAVESGPAG